MPLSAVIFDLDGTLIDANDLHAEAWRRGFEEHGYRLPVDRILKEIGVGGTQLVTTLVGEEAEEEEGEALRERHDKLYLEMIEGRAVPAFEKVEALFEALKERGLQTAVATASKKESLEKVLKQAGLPLDEWADALVTDSDVEGSKPAPDSVVAAAEKLGCSPAECVMVGDTPFDMTAARRAGAVALGVLTGAHPREALHRAGARAVYDDVADLLENLDEALHRAAPAEIAFTPERLNALMDEALSEARAGLSEGELPIGSVIARGDGRVVARGHNRARATGRRTAHAETEALLDLGTTKGEALILVTTLEPCLMCLGAAIEGGFDTVIYGLDAPANGGTERCTPPANGAFPRLVGGVRAEESRALLSEWLSEHPKNAFVRELLGETGARQEA